MKVTFVLPKLNHTEPILSLGIPYLSSCIKQKGHTANLIDGQTISLRKFKKDIEDIDAPLIAISSFQFNMESTIRLVAQLRELYGDTKTIVLGGRGPNCLPLDFVFDRIDADYIFIGEAEVSFTKFVDWMANGKKEPITNIKGIAFVENGKVVETGAPEIVWNLDDLPFPDREIYDEAKYLRLQEKYMGCPLIRISTTRGCPFNCSFCDKTIMGSKIRMRSVESLIEEIETTSRQFDCHNFYLNDDLFVASQKRLVHFCEEIIRRNIRIKWKATCRVDSIKKEETFELMKASGCDQLFFGVESGSARMLEKMDKNTKISQVITCIDFCHKYEIKSFAYFIVGFPGETLEDVNLTLSLLERCRFTGIDCFIFLPYPGSPEFTRLKALDNSFDWDTYLGWKETNFNKSRRNFLKYNFEIEPRLARKMIFDKYNELQKGGKFNSAKKDKAFFETSY